MPNFNEADAEKIKQLIEIYFAGAGLPVPQITYDADSETYTIGDTGLLLWQADHSGQWHPGAELCIPGGWDAPPDIDIKDFGGWPTLTEAVRELARAAADDRKRVEDMSRSEEHDADSDARYEPYTDPVPIEDIKLEQRKWIDL